MADTDATETPAADAHPADADRKVLQATKPELQTFGLIAVIAAAWIGAVLLFGFGGLIIGALIMVAVMMALLMWISRG